MCGVLGSVMRVIERVRGLNVSTIYGGMYDNISGKIRLYVRLLSSPHWKQPSEKLPPSFHITSCSSRGNVSRLITGENSLAVPGFRSLGGNCGPWGWRMVGSVVRSLRVGEIDRG